MTVATWHQVGIVVPDIDRAAVIHGGLASIQDWDVFELGSDTTDRMEVDGQPTDFSIRYALGGSMPQIELIQPLDEAGPYCEFLQAHGPGVHHLGWRTDDLSRAAAPLAARGMQPSLVLTGYGADGTGALINFDMRSACGAIVEFILPPTVRRPPMRAIHTHHQEGMFDDNQ